jgi:hypothetical protein
MSKRGLGGNPQERSISKARAERARWGGGTEQCSSATSDTTPSEARKRRSGGGSPRKYDDLLTCPKGVMGVAIDFEGPSRANTGGLGVKWIT